MSSAEQWTEKEKRKLKIFAFVNFGMTILMGILMGISYKQGNDVTAFASAQMMYPAAGVILALIAVEGKSRKLPVKFFAVYLVTSGLAVLLTIANVFIPTEWWYLIENYVFIIGSIVSWVMLLIEKKEIRDEFALRFGGHGTAKSLLLMLLFLGLYILRLFMSGLVEGNVGEIVKIFASFDTWIMMGVLVINFYLTFIIFFGEEYGWRYFLQPMLQKRFGLKGGVILLGVIWGLWHLPINVYYYSPDTWFFSILIHQITCITFSVFFGYAYGKSGNIWVPIVIHYINNNMAAVISGTGNLGDQVYGWKDVLLLFIINGIVFLPFLFTKIYQERKETAPL
ncbi:MAG: CPBP family intramembrane metalloprotease [Lachnospiraceae bacterium]|nr:CPBP family intramembrane metalloprotease [Lachnospiraceae bacterium]